MTTHLLAFALGLTVALVGAPHYPRVRAAAIARWNALVGRLAAWVASLRKEA